MVMAVEYLFWSPYNIEQNALNMDEAMCLNVQM